MARRKNVKRIDPRYFLNETVNRNDDGSRLEEGALRMGPLHPSKWSRRVQGWVARKNQELGDLDAVLAAAAESEPEVLAMIQAEVDRLRAGGEELEEDRNDDGSRLEEGFVDMVGSLANRAGLFGKESKHAEWWSRVAKPILKQEMGDDYDHSLAHDIRQQWKAAGSELDAETVAQTIKDAVEFSKLAKELDLLDYRSLENVRNSYTLDSLRKLVGKRAKRKDDERMKRRDRALSGRDFGPGETMATHRYDIMVNRARAARKGWDREKALDNGLAVDGAGLYAREWDGKAPDPDDLEAARKKARESTRGVGR